MRTRLPLLLTFVILMSVAVALGLAGRPANAATIGVAVDDNYFCAPAFEGAVCTTTITAGDAVTWTVSGSTHTVTQCDAAYANCPPGGGFNSGPVEAGGTFSQTFAAAGDIYYRCDLHPSEMMGKIVVQAPTPSPTPVPAGQTPGPTATPGGVPKTGGQPLDTDSLPLFMVALALGGVLMVAGGSTVLAARRID
ncbi:MAG: hypothetical protein WD904_14085 [Dehalococcoidia bacterium]